MRGHENFLKKVKNWGEKYNWDEGIMPHASNQICGWRQCPTNDREDSSVAKKAHNIPIKERIVGVDASGETPSKYADEHGGWETPMIYPPIYILQCPICTRLSWTHSGEDVEKVSQAAEEFQAQKG